MVKVTDFQMVRIEMDSELLEFIKELVTPVLEQCHTYYCDGFIINQENYQDLLKILERSQKKEYAHIRDGICGLDDEDVRKLQLALDCIEGIVSNYEFMWFEEIEGAEEPF